ncbi:AI-2E family transporter [Siccirubricoccus deserti]|uniref:AI-2E family transporter n=1 Tax=Siccirubricoccus deserti TaxID=2013562 RepID=A0A9X0QXS6_9PROT|nr:AI-2E family transporter [Siccirubricoccus deserti]MBC4015187.1 AI-2E family transporter [Siccirubricoccus deserti]GGC38298.1 AI-2E family transporter [Siccirubricoccus deserti]
MPGRQGRPWQRDCLAWEPNAPLAVPSCVTRAHASVLILLGILLALLWLAPEVPLLGFAAVLLAVALRAGADPLARRTGLPGWAAVLIIAALVALAIGLAGWAAAGPLAEQARQLSAELPRSLEALRNRMAGTGWGDWLLRQAEPGQLLSGGGGADAAAAAAQAASSTLGGLGNLVLVVLLALYLAAQPEPYLRGLRQLFHPDLEPPVADTLTEAGTALRGWLLGQAVGMAVAGLLTWLGLMALGVPLAGLLATIIGLLNFIPIIGPLIGAVPAVLLALAQSPPLALWVIALVVAVQTIEGNFLTPMVQSRTADIPPALLLLVQVLTGALFGLLGVALAAPLTALGLVLVRRGYVQEWLGWPKEE